MSRNHDNHALAPPASSSTVITNAAAALVIMILVVPRSAAGCMFDDDPAAPTTSAKATAEMGTPEAAPNPALDFELLDPKAPALRVDEAAIGRRRTLLTWHQGVGLGMFGIALANTVVGQLNYSDRFASGPSTGRYQFAHQITAGATVGAFAATGLLAFLAPTPLPRASGFDRVTLHKLAMGTAAAAIAAEVVLGVYTASREGNLNQPDYAGAHLAIGYLSFAAITLGVGTIVF